MIIVCLTCNITLPRRRGSRPDGARYISFAIAVFFSMVNNDVISQRGFLGILYSVWKNKSGNIKFNWFCSNFNVVYFTVFIVSN